MKGGGDSLNTSFMHRLIAVFTALIVAAGVVIYKLTDFKLQDLLPPCLFYKVTGLKCVGCGATRAVDSLLEGKFIAAFYYNPLFTAVIAMLLLLFILFLVNAFRKKPFFLPLEKYLYAILIAALFFWVFRNLPVYPDIFY